MDGSTFSLADLAGSRFPLLEYAPDATIIVDGEGQIRLVNGQTERLFRYCREDLLGQDIEILVPERFSGMHISDRIGYYAEPRVRPMGAGMDLFGRRKDGEEFPVEISLSPIETREGVFVAAAIRDVSERKAFERRLRELNTELENANRAKDRFLASMSHELRTPLNAILGFSGTLLMKLPGPLTQEQERQLAIVQSNARHLLLLINDILDLAKIESGKQELSFEPVVLKEVVDEVAASLARLASEKQLEFRTSILSDLPTIATDRRSVVQILLNLTSNAIKFTERGSVRIDVAHARWNGAQALAMSVSDTGIGIKPEDIDRLFQAFAQLDTSSTRRYEGTGLGLYLCHHLATLLGGDLKVASEFGAGSTFTLMLPHGR